MNTRLLVVSIILFFHACSESGQNSNSSVNTNEDGWLIPKNEVFDGGPGKDGIPAIENPKMISLNEVDFLVDDDLVVLFSKNGQLSVYPHKILDWHEIVNDNDVTVSYCPLTGTAIGLNRVIDQEKTSFGVSGLLYNTNLILYDRFSDSYWSQMKNQCVAGELIGTFPKNEILVETIFKTAKEMFQDALVLSIETGIYGKRQYSFYPYGDYKTNNSLLLFPVSNQDNRVPGKERVLGVVINKDPRAFRVSSFSGGTKVINTQLGGEAIVVIGNSQKDYCVAYKNHFVNSSESLNFSVASANGQIEFKDNLGNHYNIMGEVVTGPNSGQRLEGTHSYKAYWFAWATFYPDSEIN